jgi:hypothetical protein
LLAAQDRSFTAMRRCLCLAAALLFTLTAGARGEARKPVWIVSNGFHSGLAVRVRDLPGGREISGDPRADKLLLGWGDSAYYRRRINPRTFIAALCWPTPSALHVVPIRGPVEERFQRSDVIELSLPASRVRALCEEVDAAIARDSRGRRLFVERGYFPTSRFYAGRESFYFPKMCNLWVAQKFRRAGIPIFTPGAFFASELTIQAERCGRRLRSHRRPVDAF